MQFPAMQRLIRKVDELFLSQLIINMEKHPNGACKPLFLLVRDLKSKADFNSNEVNSYKYEVLAGTHNVLAAISLSEKYPEESNFKGRYAKLFVDLTDDEALWLASQHNTTGSFRHEITFQDEASILKICSYRRPIFM